MFTTLYSDSFGIIAYVVCTYPTFSGMPTRTYATHMENKHHDAINTDIRASKFPQIIHARGYTFVKSVPNLSARKRYDRGLKDPGCFISWLLHAPPQHAYMSGRTAVLPRAGPSTTRPLPPVLSVFFKYDSIYSLQSGG